MTELERLIRQRQDELRGRPQTWLECICERMPYRDDVIDVINLGCWILAGASAVMVVWFS
jgi:hypothetical protein